MLGPSIGYLKIVVSVLACPTGLASSSVVSPETILPQAPRFVKRFLWELRRVDRRWEPRFRSVSGSTLLFHSLIFRIVCQDLFLEIIIVARPPGQDENYDTEYYDKGEDEGRCIEHRAFK